MKKKVTIILLAFVLAILATMIWDEKKQEKITADTFRICEEKAASLETEKRSLMEKIDSLKNQRMNMNDGHGTITIIITDLDEVVFDEIWIDMQEHGMAGVLLLSEGQFPGKDGNITMEQFRQIIDSGWEYCLGWNAQGELDSWLSAEKDEFERAGLEFPETIYFSNGNYQQEQDEILKKFGISGAVCYREETVSISTTFEDSSLWCLMAYPFHVKGGKTYAENVISHDRSCAFTVGKIVKEEMYQRDNFVDMLDQLKSWREKNGLQIMTVKETRQYRQSLYEQGEDKKAELEAQIAELNRQVEELDKEINNIYKEYYLIVGE